MERSGDMLDFLIRGREQIQLSIFNNSQIQFLAPNPFDWYLNRQHISIFSYLSNSY
jgi:hypothetical protein